ncbi:type II toxin-antitoxin system Phd/YefM family antitoxin [Rhizobium halophytocola]|uniref:Antitoxin n=1 Tax=Rhizobium halophytocola TaxID=735519 RepID=A0ABS4E374_9HYPH|nr:type II toxin-antitoxin system Phd/YefM family antitoxin [Rhizobium halophytocola]MBP1852395.1 prevent-host-death family protein [Rhizobium halophytocola]
MKEIQLKDAAARLSSVIDSALDGEGSVITRDGKPQAVVISYETFQRLSKAAPSFGWLVTHSPLEAGDLPERKPARVFGEDLD